MKIINASLIPIGSKERVAFPLTELMVEGNLDPVNKVIIKKGIPYSLDSLQWDILDIMEVSNQPAVSNSTVEKTTSTTTTKQPIK